MIDRKLLARIRSIVENNYNKLAISMLGLDSDESILDKVYNKNYGKTPESKISKESKRFLNENLKKLVEQQKLEVANKFESLMVESNLQNRLKAKEALSPDSIRRIQQNLKDASQGFIKDWKRVAVTEVSNAVGLGSVDKIIERAENPHETYVYRINPNDSRTCRECRKFYIDKDGSPKLYRLSTIVGNGSNYGKKRSEWKPVTTATHPNCRDTPIIELKPGWKLLPGGNVTFMGHEAWPEYIKQKLIG